MTSVLVIDVEELLVEQLANNLIRNAILSLEMV